MISNVFGIEDLKKYMQAITDIARSIDTIKMNGGIH